MLAENVRGLGNQPVGTAGAGGEHFLGLEQRFAQREGLLPLARRHLFVPHTRRQPIGLPDRGHHHDFHVETKIGGHFPYDGGALGGFLAEKRLSRPHDREELGHHRGDAAKMIRPRHPVERLAGRVFRHERRIAPRINILGGRHEHAMRAAPRTQSHILG